MGTPDEVLVTKADLAMRRLEEVSRRTDELNPETREVMEQALEELATTLEELRVAGEELTLANLQLRRAQGELREGRRAYQELFDFAPDGYLITDPYGSIKMANVAAARRLAGGRRDALIGKPLTVLVALADRSSFFVALAGVRRTAERAEWAGRLEPRGGAPFPAQLVVVGRPDGDGDPEELLWLVHDLSDRERYEGALRASEQAFRAIAENSPDPILRLDPKLRVDYANAATERLTGRRASEIAGVAVAELGLGGDREDQLAAAFAGVLAGRDQVVEAPFDGPRGRRWLEWHIVAEHEAGGEVERLLAVSRDVTERRATEQALRESHEL
jgi:PAS domain S-box-containing protein